VKRSAEELALFLWAIAFVVVVQAPMSGALGLPPDPNNAALLYYQAFLLRPEPDTITSNSLVQLMDGAEPDASVRMYLWTCRESMDLAAAASRLPHCDWGTRYSLGLGARKPYLLAGQRLVYLFRLDARFLATKGDCRKAIAQCLVARKIAADLGDQGPVAYQCSMGEDLKALNDIRRILGSTRPDADVLLSLKEQFGSTVHGSVSLERALRMDFELALQTLRANEALLAEIRRQLVQGAVDNGAREKFEALTDQELLRRARQPYAQFLDAVLNTINANRGYGQTYTEIQRLSENLRKEYGNDPAARQIIDACARPVMGGYDTATLHAATLSSLRVALETYLAKATSGELPKVPPDNQPKDPYGGEDFEYVLTEKGFLLRCKSPDIRLGRIREFEFNVHE
jgi:hypothetical protein